MRKFNRGRMLAAAFSMVLVTGGGLVMSSATAGAITCGPVDPTIPDGDLGSLRVLLENSDATGCTTVTLEPGATYELDHDDGDIDIYADMVIEGNGATIRQTRQGSRVLDTEFSLTLRQVTITGGREVDDAGGLRSDNFEETLTIIDSTFVDNAAEGDGGAFEADGDVTVIASTFNGNCSEDTGGAADFSGESSTVVNSTFTDNTSPEDGALDLDGELLTIVYSTIVANSHVENVDCGIVATAQEEPEPAEADDEDVEVAQGGEPANISISVSRQEQQLRSFGTVVALPIGGPNCADDDDPEKGPLPNTDSAGYNFSDDATCGFEDPTDQQDAGDPALGALGPNGGPTETMVPDATSPLLNAIPIDACGDGDEFAGFAVTTDQRGVTRPQETGCEIGSVEVEPPPPAPEPAAIVLEPTFTG